MQLQDILFSQGFGTRRVCAGLVQQGFVAVRGEVCTNAAADFLTERLEFTVQGKLWPFHEKAYLILNKPVGIECSQKPSAWPSIYTLLPSPLRLRPQKGAVQGVQAVGRLDQDTTGLLLLTDDGQFIHKMSSPRHEVTPLQVQRLLDGVILADDIKPVRASACFATGEKTMQLTLTEGKYHQVKRMLAAVSNRVETLHRSQIGHFRLPDDLLPGHWRWLDSEDLRQVWQL